ncbi:DUF6497 family protein [Shimia biformata]|uniref:DUF6497 family protein n=1 Tax=Shimia biformata TaxID=1294299 RepID=UPI00194EB39A|nr:DUF6497 family protein [Shimia biformata]
MSDVLFLASSGAVTADDLPPVPSGNELYLQEVIYEDRQDGSRVARYRYVMPILRQGVEFYEVEADFQYLCETRALRELKASGEKVDQIIVSLADRETEFGEISPLVTQYFEAYTVEDGSCIWEGY